MFAPDRLLQGAHCVARGGVTLRVLRARIPHWLALMMPGSVMVRRRASIGVHTGGAKLRPWRRRDGRRLPTRSSHATMRC